MNPPPSSARTYEAWREAFSRELGVRVVDDEGRRRCARERGLDAPLMRAEAEAYFLLNTLVRTGALSARS